MKKLRSVVLMLPALSLRCPVHGVTGLIGRHVQHHAGLAEERQEKEVWKRELEKNVQAMF